MESPALATVVLDHRGIVTAAEGAAGGAAWGENLVGRPWGEAFSDWGLPSALPEDPKAYPLVLRGATPQGAPVFVEMFLLPPAGPQRPQDVRANKESSCLRAPVVALFRMSDVTGLSGRLQQLCAVGEVACGVCHEINNALTLVCGWLEVLRGDLGEDSPHLPTIRLLLEESGRIAALARNLQEVARGSAEPPHDLDLRELLGDVTGLVRREMERSRIAMDARIAADLPTVCGSAGRLKQALLNLIVNARQAMPDGGSLVLAADAGPDGHVSVSVQDTGCGIPRELQARVFGAFFTTKPDGTGLGLPITKKIIEDHGGTIRMESEPGRGSRFTILLPARAMP